MIHVLDLEDATESYITSKRKVNNEEEESSKRELKHSNHDAVNSHEQEILKLQHSNRRYSLDRRGPFPRGVQDDR